MSSERARCRCGTGRPAARAHAALRYEKLLTLAHSVKGASMLVGGPGTAKTATIKQFLGRFSSEVMAQKTITFSFLTTPQVRGWRMSATVGCGSRQVNLHVHTHTGLIVTLFRALLESSILPHRKQRAAPHQEMHVWLADLPGHYGERG